MNKFKEENKTKISKRRKLFFGIFLFMSASLIVCKVAISNSLVGASEKIAYIEREELTIIEENTRLEKKITELTSLAEIKSKASSLGLTDAKTFVFVLPNPYAMKR